MMQVSVIILAAGNASRMGKAKQLLPYKGTTLLGHAIEIAEASLANSTHCVVGAHSEAILKETTHPEVIFIANSNWASGLSTSIVAAVRHIVSAKDGTQALLITLADQPKISSTYLNTMIQLHEKHPETIIASDYAESLGVPALFPKNYWNALLQLKGDKDAKEFLNAHKAQAIAMNAVEFLFDIDTPEDYQQLIHPEL